MKIETILRKEKVDDRSKQEIGLSWTLRKGFTLNDKELEEKVKVVEQSPSSKTNARLNTTSSKLMKEGLFAVPRSPDLIQLLSRLIMSATEVICISSFLIQDSLVTDSILEEAEKGVRVYIVTAGEEDLKVADEDDKPANERIAEFKKLLGKLSDKVLLRTGDFHAKFLLIDPSSSERKGLMLTSNMTVDALSGKNQELVVHLTPQEVSSFFHQFVMGFWILSRHELRGGRLQELAEKRYVPPLKDLKIVHPCTYGDIKTINTEALDLINGAKSSIAISAWTFSPDSEIPNALLRKADEGVKITVYTRPNYLNSVTLEQLAAKGERVMAHDRYHAKAILVDNYKSLITTANFSEIGLGNGFETGVVRSGNDALNLSRIIDAWDENCEWILSARSELGELNGKVIEIDKRRQETIEREVVESKTVNIEDLHPKQIMTESEIEEPEMKYSNSFNELCKRVLFKWSVVTPKVPNGATKIRKEGSNRTFFELKGDNRLYLPISDWEDLQEAREDAKKFGAMVVIS